MEHNQYQEFHLNPQDQEQDLTNCYTNQTLLTKYFFSWLNPFIQNGLSKKLEQNDIFQIPSQDKSNILFDNFQTHFHNQRLTIGRSLDIVFLRSLFFAFKSDWIVLLLLRLSFMGILLLNPIIVNMMISMFQGERGDWPIFIKTILTFSLWISSFYFIMIISNFCENVLKAKIQVTLISKIYNQLFMASLPLPPSGELTNLIQIDAFQISNIVNCSISLLIIPFQVTGAIYIYFSMVGAAATLGVFGIIINILASLIYGKIYARYQLQIMNSRDSRIRAIEELLNGINTIKQNCYYKFFYDRIKEKRSQEMEDIKKQSYLTYFISFLFQIIPIGVLFCTFKLFSIFSLQSVLIVSQSYAQLSFAINQIPSTLSALLLSLTSIDRFMKFIDSQAERPCQSIDIDTAIKVDNGNFKWHQKNAQIYDQVQIYSNQVREDQLDNTHFQLQSIDLQIKKGSKTLILGSNGSGKSSILYSLLGELETSDLTKLYVNGSISLATQEPWILQATIKENILMQTPLDEDRFVTALEMAQLCYDLGTMPAGHNTDIGERGQTLSGGQKKRLHLCRALYQEKDIYLLDNPCAALDHTTSQRIAQAIRTQMLGKTVIITSNSTEFWEFADQIVFMQEGRIVFDGSFEQFQKSKWNSQSKQKQQDLDDLEINEKAEIAYEQTDKLELFKRFDQKQNNMIDQEDRIIGQIDKSIFKQIYNLYGKVTTFVIAGVICLTIMVTNIGYQLQFSAITQVSDKKDVSEEEKNAAVSQFLYIYPLFGILGAVLSLSVGLFLTNKGATASKILHNKITENLLKASVQYFYNVVLGSRIKNRLTNDIYQFDMGTPQQLSSIFNYSFNFMAMILACLALASMISYPIIGIYFYLEIKYTIKFLKIQLEVNRILAISKSPIINSLSETAQGIMYAKHCQNRFMLENNFNNLLNNYQRNAICSAALGAWYLQIILSVMFLMYVLVTSSNYLDLNLNDQSAQISIYLSLQVGESFMTLMTTLQGFYSSSIFLERCLYLINDVPKEDQNQIQEDEYSNFSNTQNSQLQFENDSMSQIEMMTINSIPNEPIKQSAFALELKEVNIKYRDDFELVVKDISFKLKRQQKIAIIGRTGSGKTSLMQCITRLINPYSGNLTFFGTNFKNIGINKTRSLFSVVSQDPFIFEGTLQQNIDPNNAYTDQEINQQLFEYGLMAVPILEDLQFKIQTNGQNLSQGEKQLIMMCRAILQKRNIVILDECTGNLDRQYAQIINQTLDLYMKDKSVIGITHKFDQLDMFDHIILINQGKLIAEGNKNEIIRNYLTQKQ